MNQKTTLIGGALAAALLAPGLASASMLLDTGTPTGDSGTTYTLNSGQWFAGEFHATAGEDITSVAAYLTQGSAQPGYTFTFDIYSNSALFARSTSRIPLQSFSGTYQADGWNSTSVDWTVPTDGDYWLALQVNTTNQSGGLDLPGLVSQTGTAPAEGFAYFQGSGTGNLYKSLSAPGVGLEVSTVPLPAGFWLFASGLLGLGTVAGRQRIRHFIHNISATTAGSHAAA